MDSRAAIRKARTQLDSIMALDAAWCRQRLAAIQSQLQKGRPVEKSLRQLQDRIERSQTRVELRTSGLPQPAFDPALPITAHREEILRAIERHQVIVVAGETGSGKTTQLPKFCLEAGRGTRGQIACTQPRRIAARAMAERVSEELGTATGTAVGFQVRFRDHSSPDGYVKFMTDGILLAESTHDRYLDAYDTIIIDEAHERSLNIDFLLGYLKQMLPRRRDLRLIITSATIDTEKFSRHFDGAPVIEVSGRGHPVDLVYQPLAIRIRGRRTGRSRPVPRHRRRRAAAGPHRPGRRHTGVFVGRARNPRSRRVPAAQPGGTDRCAHRDITAVRQAVVRGAASRLSPRSPAPHHPGHQRR